MKIDKNQQKPTEKATVNPQTGLTPLQEQAAILLASGETITAVAAKMSLNRGTLYEWQKLITFQCFLNQQATDYRDNLRNGLYGLAHDALQVIGGSLQSANEGIRLKAAMWLAEKVKDNDTGQTDVREALKEQCTHSDWGVGDLLSFDADEYKKELKRLGLEE